MNGRAKILLWDKVWNAAAERVWVSLGIGGWERVTEGRRMSTLIADRAKIVIWNRVRDEHNG